MMDMDIEKKIQEKGLNAPRLTPDGVMDKIAKEMYLRPEGTNLTICIIQLENGTCITGESACASAANFDEEIGREIAKKNAVDKIWKLEGYLLREQLYRKEVNSYQGGN